MTEKELIGKVHSAVYHQCQRRGYAAPVDVLMEVGVLPKQKYEDWRFGRVDYLERVCTVNLRKTLIHHAPDAGVRTENRLKTLLLLLQAMGCKKEKWAGTQAGDSAAVQQKRKLGN